MKSIRCLTWSSAILNARSLGEEISLLCSHQFHTYWLAHPFKLTLVSLFSFYFICVYIYMCVCVCVCIYIYFFLLTFAWMSQVSILLRRVFVGSSSPGESSVMNSLYHSGITTCSFPKPSGYMKWNDPSRKPRMVILMQERKRRSKRGSDLGTHTGLE